MNPSVRPDKSLEFQPPPRVLRMVRLAIVGWLLVPGGCSRQAQPQPRPDGAVSVASRVIALAPNAAEIICGLGACARLVGVSRYCDFPPEILGLPRIGGLRDPDLEAVLTLRPDLVILRGRSEGLRRMCADRGIAIYDDRVETLDDLYQTVGELAVLLHREGAATEMIAGIRHALGKVSRRVATVPKRRVLFTLRSPNTLADVLTTGRGTFVSELIEIAGGVNVFGDQDARYPSVSLEEIVARDPEVIIECMTSDLITPELRDSMMGQWRALPPISAVTSGRVHFVSDSYLTIPSQRVTLAAERFVKLIHPELSAGD